MRDLCRASGLAEVPVTAAAAAAAAAAAVVVVVVVVVVVDGNVTMAFSLVGGCCTVEEDVGKCAAVAVTDSFWIISPALSLLLWL